MSAWGGKCGGEDDTNNAPQWKNGLALITLTLWSCSLNEKILEKYDVLRGYAVFVEKVRGYQRAGRELKDAIAAAITISYCKY